MAVVDGKLFGSQIYFPCVCVIVFPLPKPLTFDDPINETP